MSSVVGDRFFYIVFYTKKKKILAHMLLAGGGCYLSDRDTLGLQMDSHAFG
jgi:hypothetical protein